MVHWVYVLECEDNYIYVGETTRLYRRFAEHINGRGSTNTMKHSPYRLAGLYKVNDNFSFMRYRNTIKSGDYNKFIFDDWDNEGDNLAIENHITERYMYERRNNKGRFGEGSEWYKVRGGRYTRDQMDEMGICNKKNPIETISVDDIVDRPLCKCDYLSEVKLSNDKQTIYFVCALKNVWGDFFSDLEVDSPCDFWQPYTGDKDIKAQYEIAKSKSRESWLTNVPLSLYKINPESCISCNKKGYVPIYNNGVRRLCQSCIVKKYQELKKQFADVCLID